MVTHPRLADEIVELLEAIWTAEEEGSTSEERVSRRAMTEITPDLLAEAETSRLLTRTPQGELRLTPEGRRTAEEVIRRHRLAERLVVDVLGMTIEESEADACEFEHLLARGVTEAICTLLGHPRFCPHQRPIPAGECCRRAGTQLNPLVTSLDRLNLGEEARVAYVSARDYPRIQKLSSLGILPGVPIRLHQKFPSFVVQCEETQIALEEEIARDVYVWRQ